MMRVFVPVPDLALGGRGELTGKLVPFSPEFLTPRRDATNKPSNWIVDDDYPSDCKRLRASREFDDAVIA